MLPDPEYDVVWNGTKDKNGECPRLSGYDGVSTLSNPTPPLWSSGLSEAQEALFDVCPVRRAVQQRKRKNAE